MLYYVWWLLLHGDDNPTIWLNLCYYFLNSADKSNNLMQELIGPYWSLRAALGPVIETIILLDRLLFLQEQDKSLEAFILPIFDPALSPRNVALIANKY